MRIRTLFSAFLIFISVVVAVSVEESRLIYFRSDGGVAGKEAGSLPEQLDSPDVLRWRTPINSGHSTPIACNGRIFLTTYRASPQELATLTLDIETGKMLRKQAAPVSLIEPYQQETGNPVQATPACDGQRLYVFFGSYGLIRRNLRDFKQLDNQHFMKP
jgi:hypothetical protein